MRSLRTTVLAKAIIWLAILSVISLLALVELPRLLPRLVPWVIYLLVCIFFFIGAQVLWYVLIVRPLAVVFREIKALLTGHPYKRIFTTRIDEVGILANFFNEVTKNFEKISVDVAEGRRMAKELAVGSDIQKKIIPSEIPQVVGLTIFGKTRPASEVGGDSFDVISGAANLYVYVGDVTGHGLPAGLIMVMVNTLIRTFSEIYKTGYDILVHTNRILKQRIEPRRFMTCVLLRWDTTLKRMYYTGGGHEHILTYRKSSGTCEVKQTGGIALGMVPDISQIIREEEIQLDYSDAIVLYSDGLIEAKNMQGEMFGVPRLAEIITQYGGSSTPEQLFNVISREFGVFVGEQVQEDDITLIVLQRT